MSPTSEPRRKAPRVRARAKVSDPSADLRPEVAEALGGLQRSLGEVAEWEHVLTTTGDDGAPGVPGVVLRARVRPQVGAPVPEAPVVEPVAVEPAPAVLPVDAPGPRRRARRGAASPASPPAVPPPVSSSLALPALASAEPMLPGAGLDDASLDVTGLAAAAPAGAFPEPDLDLSPLQQGSDPMATWVEHTSSPHRFGLTPEAARRRRNGRIASWTGAVLLVGVAAFLLIPDHSPARPTLVHEESSTSTTAPTTTSSVQFGSQFSVPTLPPTTAAPVVPVTPTPSSSSGSSSSTKRRSTTTTTQAPVVTEAPTTTEVPVTTTAPPPTTTTTIQSCPPVPGQRPGDC